MFALSVSAAALRILSRLPVAFSWLSELNAAVVNLLSVLPRDSEHLWDFKGSAAHGVASKKIDALRKDFQVGAKLERGRKPLVFHHVCADVQAKLLAGLTAAIKTIPDGANHVAQDILAQAIII